jgi:hypothetical protein
VRQKAFVNATKKRNDTNANDSEECRMTSSVFLSNVAVIVMDRGKTLLEAKANVLLFWVQEGLTDAATGQSQRQAWE